MMKRNWAAIPALLLLSDVNTPTDEALKKQFSEAQEGMMQLENISLRQ